MSNTPNRAGNPAGKPRRKEEAGLDLPTARQMLPLVRSIVSDIVTSREALSRLVPEQDRLDRHRHDLVWQERQRRYQVSEEIRTAETKVSNASAELTALGVGLVDADAGEVDFPTRINGRPAAFCWKFGEDALGHWHYTGEEQRRPVPADWDQSAATPVRFRSTP
ncbi:MAG TPA: DUF2203 domain-containing protein [Urbifossiella sp.]|nr:DUF2203 domain-containing protein [Urbifossiella sp.]